MGDKKIYDRESFTTKATGNVAGGTDSSITTIGTVSGVSAALLVYVLAAIGSTVGGWMETGIVIITAIVLSGITLGLYKRLQ